MEWFKLEARLIRSEAYIDAEPVQRATWLNLMVFCITQENGGRLESCRDWKDRKWQQLAGVTREEVHDSCLLFHWDPDDPDTLIIPAYPLDKEAQVKEARANGARGGRPPKNPPVNPPVNPNGNQTRPDQTREDQTRPDKSRPEGASGPRSQKFSVEDAVAWIDAQNGAIPNKRRAEAHARELIQEMEAVRPPWTVQGQPVRSPLALMINRLSRDGIYKP
jgi:hypothetical protein